MSIKPTEVKMKMHERTEEDRKDEPDTTTPMKKLSSIHDSNEKIQK